MISIEKYCNKLTPPSLLDRKKAKTIASLCAYGASLGTLAISSKQLKHLGKSFVSKNDEFNKDEKNKQMANATVDIILNNTPLAQKGVKIIDFKGFDFKPNKFQKAQLKIFDSIAEGKNAVYVPKDIKMGKNKLFNKNNIVVNRDKLPAALLHELGHAYNRNCSKPMKPMQTLSIIGDTYAMQLVSLASFSEYEKPLNGKELTKSQKMHNFIRKNSPALALAFSTPRLIEEGVASYRGYKWAKDTFGEKFARKIGLIQKTALLSYFIKAMSIPVSTFIARSIKDILVEKIDKNVENCDEKLKEEQ